MRNLDEPDMPGSPAFEEQTHSSSSTDLLERTEEVRSPGDSERFAHYVSSHRITESMITGKPVVALCGKVWRPSRNPDKYPICPTCKAIYESMGNQGSAWPFGPDAPGEN